jgi:hypothetical protein
MVLQPSLHSLPLELIEEIIVTTTFLGDTRAAATLSRTCCSFRALVYHQFSKHLWREMFLVVFDNPFLARDVRTHGRAPLLYFNPGKGKSRSCPSEDVFPWEDEYKRRIWTESFILRRAQPPQNSSDVEVYTALQTLLRVISTAPPLPRDELECMESLPSHRPRPHPICPPLFIAAHIHPTVVLGSRNTTWLARILAHGLPRALIARLSVYDNGEVDAQKRPVKWDGLLAKLVAQIGLMTPLGTRLSAEKQPIPPLASSMSNPDNNGEGVTADVTDIAGPPVEEGFESEDDDGDEDDGDEDDEDDDPVAQGDLRSQEPHDMPVDPSSESSSDDSDFQPGSESTSESDDEGMSEIDGDEVFGSIATQATLSLHGVRRLARIRVYNMAYLHSSRAYGPFLPVGSPRPMYNKAYVHQSRAGGTFLPANNRPSRPSCSTGFFADGEEEDQEADGGSSSTGIPPVPPIPDSTFFLSPFFDPENDYDDEGFSPGQGSDEDEDAFSSRPSSVPGDQLSFDWSWISAARLVIELNLRDLLMTRHRDILRALLSLEGLRPCTAPGFPLAAVEGEGPGCGNGRQYRDGEGWDWAGVEGQWRSVIDMTTPVLY